MGCPNCGGPTGRGPRDDPRPPAMGGHDPPPTAVFCSQECVDEYDIDKIPASFGLAVSPPD